MRRLLGISRWSGRLRQYRGQQPVHPHSHCPRLGLTTFHPDACNNAPAAPFLKASLSSPEPRQRCSMFHFSRNQRISRSCPAAPAADRITINRRCLPKCDRDDLRTLSARESNPGALQLSPCLPLPHHFLSAHTGPGAQRLQGLPFPDMPCIFPPVISTPVCFGSCCPLSLEAFPRLTFLPHSSTSSLSSGTAQRPPPP